MPAFAISNIALPAFDHSDLFPALAEMGFSGIEIAPSRVWQDTWQGLSPRDVEAYGRALRDAGLKAVGLHSLVFDHPDLGIFGDTETRTRTRTFMVHLSALCRDLGGRTLIWGGGRRRVDVAEDDAFNIAVDFMGTLAERTRDDGTCFCFEPLGPRDTDFLNTVAECRRMMHAVGKPNLRLQMDAKALVENGDGDGATFEAVAPDLVHFHANEPGLGVLGSSGAVPHAEFGDALRAIGYAGFVSAEQVMPSEGEPLDAARRSLSCLEECYG